jgi:hypothetical protein
MMTETVPMFMGEPVSETYYPIANIIEDFQHFMDNENASRLRYHGFVGQILEGNLYDAYNLCCDTGNGYDIVNILLIAQFLNKEGRCVKIKFLNIIY